MLDLLRDVALSAVVFVALGLAVRPAPRSRQQADVVAVAATAVLSGVAALALLRASASSTPAGTRPLLLLGTLAAVVSTGALVALVAHSRRR